MSIVALALLPATAVNAHPKPQANTQKVDPATQAPTVEQIIDKYVQAIGGKTAVEKINSRILKGSLITSGGSAPIGVFEKAPNKFLVIIDSPASGLSQNGYNGSVAWSKNPQRGLREISGPELENFKREYDLRREIKLKEFYPKMTLKGKQQVGDRVAYAVETSSGDGIPETMYFDAVSGLLIRRDTSIQGTTLQAYFEDYKDVGGVKLPLTIRRSRPDFSFTYKFSEISHNVTIDDAKFDKPTGQ